MDQNIIIYFCNFDEKIKFCDSYQKTCFVVLVENNLFSEKNVFTVLREICFVVSRKNRFNDFARKNWFCDFGKKTKICYFGGNSDFEKKNNNLMRKLYLLKNLSSDFTEKFWFYNFDGKT